MKEKKKRSKKKALEPKERDKKSGQFLKGHKGSGGRPKGDPKDMICRDGKLRSPEALIKDVLAVYQNLGGTAFLRKWAMSSHVNLRKFLEILFKFAPQPDGFIGDTNIQIISNIPRATDSEADKTIRDLKLQLAEREQEIQSLRSTTPFKEAEVIEHEPVSVEELPSHSEEEKSDSVRELKETEEEIPISEEKAPDEQSLDEIRKKLEKLPEKEMLELYKKLEKEQGSRVDPENYKPAVIVRNYLLILKRKRENEAKRPKEEKLIPLTEREEDLVWGKRRGGISES